MNPETRPRKPQLAGIIQNGAAAALLVAAFLPLVSLVGLIDIGLEGGVQAYGLGIVVATAGLWTSR